MNILVGYLINFNKITEAVNCVDEAIKLDPRNHKPL